MRKRWLQPVLSAGLATLMLSQGCANGLEPLGSHEDALSSQTLTLEIKLPRLLAPDDVVLAGTNSVLIDGQSVVREVGSGPSTLSNEGTSNTDVGSETRVGSIYSHAPVLLRNGSKVAGLINTDAVLTMQSSVTIGGPVDQAANLTPVVTAWPVTFPASGGANVTVSSGQSTTLVPGRYGNVVVDPTGTLTLQAGTYYFTSLDIELSGNVGLQNAAAPVFVYLQNSLVYRGSITEAPGQRGALLLGYFGTQPLSIEAPFTGTIVAPSAKIDLGSAGPHAGGFYAKDIEVHSGVTVTHVPFAWEFLREDKDCDGMADVRELELGLNPSDPSDAKEDPDHDGIPNRDELVFGGNPYHADSNDNGIDDPKELLLGRDLDGDHLITEKDNCPKVPNPGQEDADQDGVGDACDSTPGGSDVKVGIRTLMVAKDPQGRYALVPTTRDLKRMLSDEKGKIATGTSMAFVDGSVPGTHAITELFNETTGDHAYTATAVEQGKLIQQGYVSRGVIGSLGDNPLPFGESVSVRRFVSTGLPHREVVTTDPSEAAAVIVAGYAEVASLGFGLVDRGHLRKPISVVRYRRTEDGATLHSVLRAGDVDLTGYGTDGVRFSVLPEQTGASVPLFRLRSATGEEALSTDASDIDQLQAYGYVIDGVIGHVYPAGPVDTRYDLTPLFRLSGPGLPLAYAAGNTEAAALVSQGYTTSLTLGKVVAASPRITDPLACVGRKSQDQRLSDALSTIQVPAERAVTTLKILVTACGIERALTGQISTAFETRLATSLAPADAETKAQVLRRMQAWHAVSPALRAAELGPYAAFDPTDCQQPASLDGIDLTGPILQPLGGGIATTGVPLRAPQCSGVTYAPGSTFAPGEDARAISTTQGGESVFLPGDEIPTQGESFAAFPELIGVKADPTFALAPELNAFAADHPSMGFPLAGVVVGPCAQTSPACNSAMGEMCVQGECRAYPVVPVGSQPVFSGVSFWDKLCGRVRFTPLDFTGPVAEFSTTIGTAIGATPDQTCDASPLGGPNEPFVDTAQLTGRECEGQTFQSFNLAPNHFYQVEIVNRNGHYYKHGEQLSLNKEEQLAQGRTVHLCDSARCAPLPDPVASACSINDANGPTCGDVTGGLWNVPPRTLTDCQTNGPCPETPLEFSSGTNAGIPTVIFVSDQMQTQFVNAKLHSVRCDDETGWDAGGDDELVILLDAITSGSPTPLAGDDVGDQFDVAAAALDANSGYVYQRDLTLSSMELTLSSKANVTYLIQVGEDDDKIAQLLIAGLTGGAAGFGASFAPVFASQLTGAAAAGTLVSIGVILGTDPDDFIGQAVWTANVADVSLRGQLGHDGDTSNDVPVLTRVTSFEKHIGAPPFSSVHPAIDGLVGEFNGNLISCAKDSDCPKTCFLNLCGIIPNECYVGACVPSAPFWSDPTLPPPDTTGVPGPTQVMNFGGAGADYTIYMSFSATDEQVSN